MALAPRLTVPLDAPLIAAAVVPAPVPVPLAFSVVLLLNVKEEMAETSNVAPAPMLISALWLIEPPLPNASVPALIAVPPPYVLVLARVRGLVPNLISMAERPLKPAP